MDEILVACGDIELLRRIVSDLPEGRFEPVATRTGRGMAEKIDDRRLPLAIVHEDLEDDGAVPLCISLQKLDPRPAVLFLADSPPDEGPFDRAVRYPVPGPVLRNAIDELLQPEDADEDVESWKAFYKEVAGRLERAEDQDYYELLGVAPDAPYDAVVEAFDDLSHRYHPDRYEHLRDRRWGQALHEHVQALYTLLTEAHRVLADRQLRKRYDRLRSRGELRLPSDELSSPDTGPESLAETAETSRGERFLEMAQTELAKENYRDALQNLKFASNVEPDNPYIDEKIDELEEALN
ncbi:MAG: DnaJ domain-containing protein [Bradymonadaceae bacterium]